MRHPWYLADNEHGRLSDIRGTAQVDMQSKNKNNNK